MSAGAIHPGDVNRLLHAAAPGAAVYLIAAGGCGMSALAHLFLDLGFAVHGSDLVENSEICQLRERGAVIHCGHAAEQLRAAAPVLVVYSSAIRAGNVEVQAAREAGLPLVRRAVALAALMQRKEGICVAGMHGKTTTSALLAWALKQLGAGPSYAVGSAVPQLARHARFNTDPAAPLFVAEADESDGTLGEFRPSHAVLLNVDEEHLDYFTNVQNVCREFDRFAAQATGTLVLCADDQHLACMMERHPKAVSFGFSSGADYRAEIVSTSGSSSSFAVWHRGDRLGMFEIALRGEKNVSNACAAIALLHRLNFAPAEIARGIKDFRGAARRQQELFAQAGVRVYDDYGHHPNEIRATLQAFRASTQGRLVVVFQPHRYTRTLHLMQQFAGCFSAADRLFLTDVYAASEPEIAGATSGVLAQAMRAHGQAVEYIPSLADVPAALQRALQPGDTLLFMGAGDITQCAHAFAKTLKERINPCTFVNTAPTSLAEQFRSVVTPRTMVHPDEPLSRRTTLRVGGIADYYIEPACEADLAAVLRVCGQTGTRFTIIGRGSNLLIRDGGIRGVVLCLAGESFSRIEISGPQMRCGAGAKLKAVSVEARRAGLAGLEFLEGIPGSVGGGLRMNAGAMGSWMFEVVESLRYMDYDGNIHERKASEVNVEYRGCPLLKSNIALGAVLRGIPADKEAIQARANQYNAKRWESQPAQPSAGCIFKNPKTVPAGRLIDELGLKGTRRGGAAVSTIHGNFIVNEGGATAADVLALIDFIKQTAKAKRDIDLETEVEILGSEKPE